MKKILLGFLILFSIGVKSQVVKCGPPAMDSDINNTILNQLLQPVVSVLLDGSHSYVFGCDSIGGAGRNLYGTSYYISTHAGSTDSAVMAGFGNKKTVSGTKITIAWDSTAGGVHGSRPSTEYQWYNYLQSTFAGTSHITTLGTITSGTWNGSLITGTYGGAGVNNGSNTCTWNKNVTVSYDSSFSKYGTPYVTSVSEPTLYAPAPGASGYVWTSNGSASAPTWQVASGGAADSGIAGSASISVTAAKPRVPSIRSTWAGQSAITTVGTLTSGATGTGFTVALGSSTLTGTLPILNGGTGGTYITTDSIKVTGGSMIVNGQNKMTEQDSAQGSQTALAVSYTNFVGGEEVRILYNKTTASNLVLTFPTTTTISQSSHGIWASTPTETLVGTSSSQFLIKINKFGGRYVASIIQITP